MTIEHIPANVIKSTYRLIHDFISRRMETVVRALFELRPDLFLNDDYFKLKIKKESSLIKRARLVQWKIRNGTYLWNGIWRKNWHYRLHGEGCKLTHLKTYEQHDWDISNPDIFFTGQILSYLNWMSSISENNVDLTTYLTWTKGQRSNLLILLKHLKEKKLLSAVGYHKWKIHK